MSSIPPFSLTPEPAAPSSRGPRPSAPVSAVSGVAQSNPASSQVATERAGQRAATARADSPAVAPTAPTTEAVEPATATAQISPEDLQKQFDSLLAPTQTALQFRVDEEADRLVVSVIEQESGEVLLQIPSEVAIRIARSLAANGRGLVSATA